MLLWTYMRGIFVNDINVLKNMGAVKQSISTFPRLESCKVLFLFVVFLCLLRILVLAEYSTNYDSVSHENIDHSSLKNQLRSRFSVHIPLNPGITTNIRRPSYQRRTRDTLKYSVQEELRRRNLKPPYLKKRIPSSSPWSTLYNQEYRGSHTTSVNVYGPPSQTLSDADPFKTHISQRVLPSNQMVTVLKTQGASSMQVVQPKDFYKNINLPQDGFKGAQNRNAPSNLTQAKVSFGIDEDLENVRLANEHFMKMRKIGKCHAPMPEIVCVKDHYLSETKEYLPRCTLLHRCSDRSGCCEPDTHCAPKAIQEVSLNFYTILVSNRSSEGNVADSVVKLLFENHTECECSPVEDPPTQTSESESTTSTSTSALSTAPTTTTATTESTTFTTSVTSTTTTAETLLNQQPQKDHSPPEASSSHHIKRCQDCPEPFCRREYLDGHCSCDCFDKQRPCLKIKRGREALEEKERRCVETNRCHVPDCEFGKYLVSTGRCPKKPDHLKTMKSDHWKHEYNRWSLYERD